MREVSMYWATMTCETCGLEADCLLADEGRSILEGDFDNDECPNCNGTDLSTAGGEFEMDRIEDLL